LVNVNFADRDGESSIINTDVAGGVSTSTRLGYRWLNGDRSWMYGLNAGYDSRTIKSGDTDTNIPVSDKQTIFFNQIALNVEAVSNSWTFNGYGLIPVGDVEQRLNSVYEAGALNTYGLDVGYFITPQLNASVGYYYQYSDQEDVDGSGVRGRLAYDISQGLTAGVNISYDEDFDTRVSADLQVRFGGPSTTAAKKKKWETPTINALTASPRNRDVRVHDGCFLVTRDTNLRRLLACTYNSGGKLTRVDIVDESLCPKTNSYRIYCNKRVFNTVSPFFCESSIYCNKRTFN